MKPGPEMTYHDHLIKKLVHKWIVDDWMTSQLLCMSEREKERRLWGIDDITVFMENHKRREAREEIYLFLDWIHNILSRVSLVLC